MKQICSNRLRGIRMNRDFVVNGPPMRHSGGFEAALCYRVAAIDIRRQFSARFALGYARHEACNPRSNGWTAANSRPDEEWVIKEVCSWPVTRIVLAWSFLH